MNKKSITLGLLALLPLGIISAEYKVTIKLMDNIQMRQWENTSPLYGEWKNVGYLYDCNNWAPDASAITVGVTFNQTATDCKQDQERNAQNRETDKNDGTIRNIGDPYIEKQYINENNVRSEVGTLENWVATTPINGDWINSGSVYNCTGWTPAASTGNVGTTVNQTSTNCSQNQTRTVQNREIEMTTGNVRNVGSETIGNQVLTGQTGYQSVAGTKLDYVFNSTQTFFSCEREQANPNRYRSLAKYNGQQVFTLITYGEVSGARCSPSSATGALFTGTDGYTYTIGAAQSGSLDGGGRLYAIKRN